MLQFQYSVHNDSQVYYWLSTVNGADPFPGAKIVLKSDDAGSQPVVGVGADAQVVRSASAGKNLTLTLCAA
jgi:hypothetical protein